jgi:hypothetical protein
VSDVYIGMFAFWSNRAPDETQHTYWVHDDPVCLLAAKLEGHGDLYRWETGDNPTATCCLCKQRFVMEKGEGDAEV